MTGAEELKAIRERHEADKGIDRLGSAFRQGYLDVAFLLAEVERLKFALRFAHNCAKKNLVPGQPKTKLRALGRIVERTSEALKEPAQ
jgi:hypothetical protein